MASSTTTHLIFLSILFSAALLTSAGGPCQPKPPVPKKQPPVPKKQPAVPKKQPPVPKKQPAVPKKGPPANPFCPRDTLKLGACSDLLGLVNVLVGSPPSGHKCCAVLEGLADLEAASCLCTVIKANVLGINLNVPVALSALISSCKKTIPPGFKCV